MLGYVTMGTDRDRTRLAKLSSWLIGSLAGVLALLAFLTYQATGPKHRHLIDGAMVAHDHRTIGVHAHSAGSPAGDDKDQPTRRSGEDEFFLGEISLLLLVDFDFGLQLDRPDAVDRLYSPPAMGKRRTRDAWVHPRRGPPASLITAS